MAGTNQPNCRWIHKTAPGLVRSRSLAERHLLATNPTASDTRRELAMPSESSIPNTQDANASMSSEARVASAQKGAATVRRHKQDRRDESLRHIRAQIADGTLVVRQMTAAERGSGSRGPAAA